LTLIAKEQKDALDNKDEIHEAFSVFDKEGTGFLTREQVEHVIKNIGEELPEEETTEMLDSFKYDNDGKISVETFVDTVFNGK
jgi:calmodulin